MNSENIIKQESSQNDLNHTGMATCKQCFVTLAPWGPCRWWHASVLPSGFPLG